MSSTIRLAFSTLGCPNWSLERAAAAARDLGYRGLELRLLDGDLVGPDLSQRQQRRVRNVLADCGLDLCCLDTSFKIADPESDLAEAFACMDLAASLGSPLIRLFAGAPNDEILAATVARTAERLDRLGERGDAVGVTVGLETHDSFARGAVVAEVVSDVSDNVAVIWDTLNPIVAGEMPRQTFAAVADRLAHVHVKDGAVPPDFERNELLGRGRVPIREILTMLVNGGYDRWLSVEWEKKWQPAIPGPEVALPWYADQLRAHLGELLR